MINIIKKFVEMKKDLYEAGVISTNMCFPEVLLDHEKFDMINRHDLKIATRNSVDFPYEIYFVEDGTKYFSLLRQNELAKYPQLKKLIKEALN